MKRDFLKDLGIDGEVVDKIMAEHGKSITKLQDKFNAKDTELKQAQEELTAANEEIKEHKKIDVDKLKSEAEEWKSKYTNFERDAAVDKFFGEYKFTSELAKKAAVTEFKSQNFKMNEGKFEGADKYMEEFKKNNEGAFIVEDTEQNRAGTYSYTPSGGNSGGTDEFAAGLDGIFGK